MLKTLFLQLFMGCNPPASTGKHLIARIIVILCHDFRKDVPVEKENANNMENYIIA